MRATLAAEAPSDEGPQRDSQRRQHTPPEQQHHLEPADGHQDCKQHRRRGHPRRQRQQKAPSRPESVAVPPELLGAALERQHVDYIYEKIAPHFNHTRNRPWPRVAAFIESLAPDALLVDVGCGNGKYLHCRPGICNTNNDDSEGCSASRAFSCLSIGIDRSKELLRCASQHHQGGLGPRLIQADCLHTPIRDGIADGVLCIAVLHHLTTEARRSARISLKIVFPALSAVLVPQLPLLSQLEALQHEAGSVGERRFPSQDVLVPWVYQKRFEQSRAPADADGGNEAGGFSGPLQGPSCVPEASDTLGDETVYRYYRVFTQDELLGLCAQEQRVKVLDCWNDTNNWAVLLERRIDT
ncbi:tRNA (uracil-5-)-methyltransferase related protein [Cyclospora cayetanensis]|uniref:tRNA (Uracil-5-)-methyltransferase related protein n=1 Tax=Cyclospora cayetanensis TaxID=88456 RepID=A0A1D3CZI8_9EIME|nr:tRNA (uracil-5-)-methyltransferase related protein [Cyclospora cayetanensis]